MEETLWFYLNQVSARFFGGLAAIIVYSEIHLAWGELWYGVKFWRGYLAGYPWGSERVAYNTQFIGTEYNCGFLNYDQVLYSSILACFIGYYLRVKNWRPQSALLD
jgi:hypothetical protein